MRPNARHLHEALASYLADNQHPDTEEVCAIVAEWLCAQDDNHHDIAVGTAMAIWLEAGMPAPHRMVPFVDDGQA